MKSTGLQATLGITILSRPDLPEHRVQPMTDSSSSSSSNSSSTSSSSSSDEEEEIVTVSPLALLQQLSLQVPDLDPGRISAERSAVEASTSEAALRESPPDPFNSFTFWKLDISEIDLPETHE